MRFQSKDEAQNTVDQQEYDSLGVELRRTTREKMAVKFGLSPSGMSSISRLTVDEFSLIKALIEDRQKSLDRRKFLRRLISY